MLELSLSEDKAAYYTLVFDILDELEGFTSFPGGYTRTLEEKLKKTELPEYTQDIDASSYIEIEKRLKDIRSTIKDKEKELDEVVRQLYGVE